MSAWPLGCLYLQERLDQHAHVHRVVAWNGRVLASKHSSTETSHIVCSEWWHQCAHLVNDATERPDIRLKIIWLILPDLRTCIVRSACLRLAQAVLGNLRYVQVTQLCGLVLVEKDICTFHVSVENTELVKCLKTSDNLDYNLPNSVLLPKLLLILMFANALEDVSIIREFHHDAVNGKVKICRWYVNRTHF